ncbi:MAG: hypothetical protein CSA97_04260 [Bacteroidetes bacterium]|nr:MAG: hypothetical protein CSA97_04260 [Bacteroidota bacterium]
MRSNDFGCLASLLVLVLLWGFLGPYALLLLPILGFVMIASFVHRLRRASEEANSGARSTGGGARGTGAFPILVLLAAVMKADGRVMRSELDYVRNFLTQNFGQEQAADMLLEMRDLLRGPLPVQQACMQIRLSYSPVQRQHLMGVLYGLSQADGFTAPSEKQLLEQIAMAIGVGAGQYSGGGWNSRGGGYSGGAGGYSRPSTDYYKVLGVDASASDAEIRKTYRKLAMKWHPDRFSTSSEAEQREASEKFKEINEAYEAISKQRGMK